MPEYYLGIWSGEQIDAAIGRAQEGGVLDTNMAATQKAASEAVATAQKAQQAAENAIPNTATINGKKVADNPTLGAADVGAYTKGQTNQLLAKKQDTLTFDDAPTEGSANPVKSGGVYSALQDVDGDASAAKEIALASFVTGTAAGNPVTLDDGADGVPVKSMVVKLEPKQDLHGYDHPWPGGGGRNLLKCERTDVSTENGITWTVNRDDAGNVISITANGTATAATTANVNLDTGTPVILKAGESYALSGCPSGGGANKFRLYRRDYGSEWYDEGNGCVFPVSDTDSACIIRMVVYAGYTANNLVFRPMLRLASDTDPTFAPYSNICPIEGYEGVTVSRSGDDTSNPTTYPVTWETEAGTVYGGTLDVTTGLLTVTYKGINVTSSNVSNNGLTEAQFEVAITDTRDKAIGIDNLYCSIFSVNKSFGDYTIRGRNATSTVTFRLPASVASSISEAKTWVDNNPFSIVYELAAPLTYQLTPQEITTLLGDNTIWSDEGTIELTYRRDPSGAHDKIGDYKIGIENGIVYVQEV